jgi:sugar lactone lactonase YvrE
MAFLFCADTSNFSRLADAQEGAPSPTPTVQPSSSSLIGIITTTVGDGTSGYSGDGGQTTSAMLSGPNGVALDSSGNIYIADTSNHAIRFVNVSTGLITTVAGTGISGGAGFSGDGGQATSANLDTPYGIALDTSGNIYIADSGNNRIRKVTVSSSLFSTVAGTGSSGYSGDGAQATSALINYPVWSCLDTTGNVIFADLNNYVIRKVTVGTGIITTVAGNGTYGYSGDGGQATSAMLSYPYGVAMDSLGNIYIADTDNGRIRKVTISTGIITTVVGTGTNGYSGDGGKATLATMNYPSGIALDSSENFYISDTYNSRIRKVTYSTGNISTVAGTGVSGYSGDSGQATSAALNRPSSAALDSSGKIYFSDKFNNRIRVFSQYGAPTGQPTARKSRSLYFKSSQRPYYLNMEKSVM